MFGRKKREQQRIGLANPNYWIIDEYHQHENEGSHKMMTKEDVQNMRDRRMCTTCINCLTPIGAFPCKDCRHTANNTGWTPSALFLALEEALSVAADKPVEAKAMTADEAIIILRSLWIDRKTDTALKYAIDAIRRDSENDKMVRANPVLCNQHSDRDTMLFCPDCQKLLVRSTCTEVEKEYVKEKLAALRKVLVGNLAFGERISIRPLLDIINRIKTD